MIKFQGERKKRFIGKATGLVMAAKLPGEPEMFSFYIPD